MPGDNSLDKYSKMLYNKKISHLKNTLTMNNSFPTSAEKFFIDLKENNTKEWFEDNRERYNNEVLFPAQAFVELLGAEAKTLRPAIQAIPKIDKSIFRLHRDVRFSPNKSPYKTHLGIFLWEGERKKMECPGLYFHIEPGQYFVGVGLYMFPPDLLKMYRKAVSQPDNALALHTVMEPLKEDSQIELCNKHFKKTPRGFQADFPHSEYLLYNGLFGMISGSDFSAIEGEKAPAFCMDGFRKMLDLHIWLVENL